MKQPSKNLRRANDVSDEELWREIEEAFTLLPPRPSRAADFKVIRPPATGVDLARMLATWGIALPATYLDFLRESNGAEGCVNDNEGDYLTLWGSGELIARNTSLPIPQILPELLTIGTDGRGGWVGFDRWNSDDAERWPVVRYDSGSSRPAGLRELAPNFQEWRKGRFQLRPGGFVCCGG